MPLIEAMASGVPVMTSNTTALPEVAGEAALLIDPYSVPAIAGCLERLLHSPALTQRLIDSGLEQARRFAWESEAQKLAAGYATFFARQPRPARLRAREADAAEGVEQASATSPAHQPLLG